MLLGSPSQPAPPCKRLYKSGSRVSKCVDIKPPSDTSTAFLAISELASGIPLVQILFIKPNFEAYWQSSYQSLLTKGSPPSQSIILTSNLAAESNNSLIFSELIPSELSGLLPA